MPIYALYRVPHAWLVEPTRRIPEAYVLEDGQRRLHANASGDDIISVGRMPPRPHSAQLAPQEELENKVLL